MSKGIELLYDNYYANNRDELPQFEDILIEQNITPSPLHIAQATNPKFIKYLFDKKIGLGTCKHVVDEIQRINNVYNKNSTDDLYKLEVPVYLKPLQKEYLRNRIAECIGGDVTISSRYMLDSNDLILILYRYICRSKHREADKEFIVGSILACAKVDVLSKADLTDVGSIYADYNLPVLGPNICGPPENLLIYCIKLGKYANIIAEYLANKGLYQAVMDLPSELQDQLAMQFTKEQIICKIKSLIPVGKLPSSEEYSKQAAKSLICIFKVMEPIYAFILDLIKLYGMFSPFKLINPAYFQADIQRVCYILVTCGCLDQLDVFLEKSNKHMLNSKFTDLFPNKQIDAIREVFVTYGIPTPDFISMYRESAYIIDMTNNIEIIACLKKHGDVVPVPTVEIKDQDDNTLVNQLLASIEEKDKKIANLTQKNNHLISILQKIYDRAKIESQVLISMLKDELDN